ncbi:MAG TPA: hypothetical protein VN029_11990 [Sphingomonas sp.]|nr:hypothetical protein [Sphingomonas sp.]
MFWKLFAPIAVVEIAIFTGWYAVWREGENFLAALVLAGGTIVMFMQLLLVLRAAQYVNHADELLKSYLGQSVKRAGMLPRGRVIAISMTVACILMNGLVLGFAGSHKQPDKPPQAPASRSTVFIQACPTAAPDRKPAPRNLSQSKPLESKPRSSSSAPICDPRH